MSLLHTVFVALDRIPQMLLHLRSDDGSKNHNAVFVLLSALSRAVRWVSYSMPSAVAVGWPSWLLNSSMYGSVAPFSFPEQLL